MSHGPARRLHFCRRFADDAAGQPLDGLAHRSCRAIEQPAVKLLDLGGSLGGLSQRLLSRRQSVVHRHDEGVFTKHNGHGSWGMPRAFELKCSGCFRQFGGNVWRQRGHRRSWNLLSVSLAMRQARHTNKKSRRGGVPRKGHPPRRLTVRLASQNISGCASTSFPKGAQAVQCGPAFDTITTYARSTASQWPPSKIDQSSCGAGLLISSIGSLTAWEAGHRVAWRLAIRYGS